MRKWLLGLLAFAGTAPLVAGRRYSAHLDRCDDERFPGLGSRVEVGDLTLHARVLGPGHSDGPTVVFENGMSSPLEFWGWIQPAVAQVATTVSYDRAGVGWSGRRRSPHTADQVAAELEDLLAALGRPGPYVLVGHSYGGLLVRRFAHRNPDRVAGMVLVDSAHPDQFDRSSRQRLGLSPTISITRQRALATSFGLARKKSADETAPLVAGLPEAEAAAAKARLRSAHTWRGTATEMTAWLDQVNPEIRETGIPPDCRLAVITSGLSIDADPVHGALQRELADLADEGRHEILADAEHMTLLTEREHAQIVAKVIEEMVLSVRGTRPQGRDHPRQGE
jgi:pimeloyl-ACP methyl ester carboxylesterase